MANYATGQDPEVSQQNDLDLQSHLLTQDSGPISPSFPQY